MDGKFGLSHVAPNASLLHRAFVPREILRFTDINLNDSYTHWNLRRMPSWAVLNARRVPLTGPERDITPVAASWAAPLTAPASAPAASAGSASMTAGSAAMSAGTS